ncbi:MAG: reprolysin-like metallopeptidase [Planctomycetota bacterium]
MTVCCFRILFACLVTLVGTASITAKTELRIDRDEATGRALSLQLGDNRVLRVAESPQRVLGSATITSGSITNGGTGSYTIATVGDRAAGRLVLDGIAYRISMNAKGEFALSTIAEKRPCLSCHEQHHGEEHHAVLDLGQKHGDHASTNLAPLASAIASTAPTADDGTVIDLLVAYTPETVAFAGSVNAVEAEIIAAIDATNTSLANSGLGHVSVNLVLLVPTDYNNTSSFSTDLSRLRNEDGSADELLILRDAAQADLVALITHSAGYIGCGIASIGGFSENAAFSVTELTCALNNLTLPHELGHNFGCLHDFDNAGVPPTTTAASFGLIFGPNNIYRTIMAQGSAVRIEHFSNPSISFMGSPTGVSGTGPDSANNAAMIELTRTNIAQYRDSALRNLNDCNNNATIDAIEFANNPSLDCDENLELDSCQIAANLDLDCNNNGTLDSCEVGFTQVLDGTPKSPVLFGTTLTQNFTNVPFATGDANARVIVTAGFASNTASRITANFNDAHSINLNGNLELNCVGPLIYEFTVPASAINAGFGNVTVTFTPSIDITSDCSGNSSVEVIIEYPAGNLEVDSNSDGIPDECQICFGDANGDQTVNVADFIAVLLNFGSNGQGVLGDANADNTVDVADFITVLLNFGSACE